MIWQQASINRTAGQVIDLHTSALGRVALARLFSDHADASLRYVA
jgi:DNA-binding IclR family transcriptional regulator